MRKTIFLLFIVACVMAPQSSEAREPAGFVDFNVYPYDTRDVSVVTLNMLADWQNGIDYFGFINFQSAFTGDSVNEEAESFYTEQNLVFSPFGNVPVGVGTQWTLSSGPDNDSLRFGFIIKVSSISWSKTLFEKIGLFYLVRLMPIQIDSLAGFNGLVEHYYSMLLLPRLFDRRVYLSGFADHFISENANFWVTETQLGVRTWDQFFVVAEFRHNEFDPKIDGLGLGLEYRFNFGPES